MFDVSGLVVIVTGSSGGNGFAISDTLQKLGCIVINADLPDCDITNNNDIDSLLLKACNYNGQINGLINCAGVTFGNNLFDYNDEDWDKTYEVNLKAPYQLTKKVAVYMKNTGGSIINITSLNSELGFPNNPAYIATKGGLKQLTKSFARDLGQYNIRVNNIGPGYIKTNMTKNGWNNNRKEIEDRTILGRWGEPEDLIGAVIFLLSKASSYITGQDIYVDGGYLAKGL
jgi:NAD(P)-dependent dehydrogenase (short-subunit alcohol dehydrogenase family)